MTRLQLLLSIACVTGAAATVAPRAPKRPSPTPPAQSAVFGTARSAPADRRPNIDWVARFGIYDVRQGSWSFFPNPKGC
jgi:hypothetical protein